ncbi:hypothetical protein [Polaribacter sp.]|uniref:hypothetical protein n=1 Tax=Polaribacter sp. TaxID=1920175 RepID=UPI0040489449
MLLFFFTISYGQKTFWKKTDSEGTAYLSFIKGDNTFGDHFRFYYTGDDRHYLMRLRYDYSLDVYRMRKDDGWSGKNYIYFKSGFLYMNLPSNEFALKFKRIDSDEIPNYIYYDTNYPERVVRN